MFTIVTFTCGIFFSGNFVVSLLPSRATVKRLLFILPGIHVKPTLTELRNLILWLGLEPSRVKVPASPIGYSMSFSLHTDFFIS